jgi:hypothetical protein
MILGTGGNDQTAVPLTDDKDLQDKKAGDLKALAIRETVIWGFLANSSLLNLFIAAIPNWNGFRTLDYIICGVLIPIAALILILSGCMSLTKTLKRTLVQLVAMDSGQEEAQESGMLSQQDQSFEQWNQDSRDDGWQQKRKHSKL